MSEELRNKFKKRSKDFTRSCLLSFPILVTFILNLIRRSLQMELNNFIKILPSKRISKQTFSAARKKLLPEVFIELNKTLIQEFYTDNEFKTLFNRRVIVVDGSTLQLPTNDDIIKKYGICKNQTTRVPMARISYAYDVLNDITLDAIIGPFNESERKMAIQHVKNIDLENHSEIKDLYIEDRGYPSTSLFFFYDHLKKEFIIRCKIKFSFEISDIVKKGCKEEIINWSTQKISSKQKAELQKIIPAIDFNKIIQLRVLVIPLNSGEKEVLITNLLDKEKFKYKDFADFYFQRWKAEENYKFHKVRLEIENFSGESTIAVKQDFHATIFTCNIRSMLANEAEEELRKKNSNKTLKYEYKINKNISAGILKDEIIKVLLKKNSNLKKFCNRLKKQMKLSMVPIIPGRKYSRRKKSIKKYFINIRRAL